MFEIGDLVTVDSEILRRYVHVNIHTQWSTNPYGIVLQVEGYEEGATILVKVHFQSLRQAYWLYAHEVIRINPPATR
tara:strand:- start:49 stop:279 length:231 start_codon:yes stop_codon:yes gene_type:complete